jgi:hypothetical protein
MKKKKLKKLINKLVVDRVGNRDKSEEIIYLSIIQKLVKK